MGPEIQQLIHAKRFDQVLSCPEPQALDNNRNLVSVGHHDDRDVAQFLVPGNVLEHLEALGDGQIDLGQDDVHLSALAVEHVDHLPWRLGAGHLVGAVAEEAKHIPGTVGVAVA